MIRDVCVLGSTVPRPPDEKRYPLSYPLCSAFSVCLHPEDQGERSARLSLPSSIVRGRWSVGTRDPSSRSFRVRPFVSVTKASPHWHPRRGLSLGPVNPGPPGPPLTSYPTAPDLDTSLGVFRGLLFRGSSGRPFLSESGHHRPQNPHPHRVFSVPEGVGDRGRVVRLDTPKSLPVHRTSGSLALWYSPCRGPPVVGGSWGTPSPGGRCGVLPQELGSIELKRDRFRGFTGICGVTVV